LQYSQEENDEKHVVKISSDLYLDIKKAIQDTGFASVDDYVNYVLRMVVGKQDSEEKEGLSQEDSEAVASRLKALGYI